MIEMRANRPWETEESKLFRASLRRFLAAEAAPKDERWRKQKFVDREFWRLAGDMGFLCPAIAEDYGGGGASYVCDAVTAEELAYAGITSFQQQIHGAIVAPYIAHYGTEAQKRKWLPPMCAGELIAALGMTEPDGGSDLKALRTTARREGDHYVINGAKTFITNGQVAGLLLLAAKTDVSQGARGLSMIVLELEGLEGFRRGRSLEKIGMNGSDTVEMFFDDVRVPVANLLGEEGQGFSMMMQQLSHERVGIAVGAQAMMERAIEVTVDYVRQRQVFGQPLSALQNTRFKLAECLSAARVSRAFLDDCIARHVRGELTGVDASMAKYWCTEKADEVIDECLQLHGGNGYMIEYPIARMYADMRVQRIYGGANEVMKEVIARSFD